MPGRTGASSVIVLITLLGIILARGFDVISNRHFYAALLIWAVFVLALQVGEACWQRQQPAPQHETFCCMHCAVRKPVDQLSTEMNRMCLECSELYETVQDEP